MIHIQKIIKDDHTRNKELKELSQKVSCFTKLKLI